MVNLLQDAKEVIIKKDKEIERQKNINNELLYTPFKKMMREEINAERKKARSIVAMLFWEWKRKQRLYLNHKSRSDKVGWGLYEQANIANTLFAVAHKMLKDN